MPRSRSGTKAKPPAFFVASFSARLDQLARTRHAFSTWLEENCADADACGDLSIVFSELTANAVAATPEDSLEVVARAWCEGADVVLEVANLVDVDRAENSWDLGDALRSGGRGLVIVDAFVDELSTHEDEAGRHVVRCRRRDAERP